MAGITAAKAKRILKHGKIGGKPLTAKQKAYFALIAGGGKPSKAQDKGHKVKWGYAQDAKTAGSLREDELPWGGMHTPEPQKPQGEEEKNKMPHGMLKLSEMVKGKVKKRKKKKKMTHNPYHK